MEEMRAADGRGEEAASRSGEQRRREMVRGERWRRDERRSADERRGNCIMQWKSEEESSRGVRWRRGEMEERRAAEEERKLHRAVESGGELQIGEEASRSGEQRRSDGGDEKWRRGADERRGSCIMRWRRGKLQMREERKLHHAVEIGGGEQQRS